MRQTAWLPLLPLWLAAAGCNVAGQGTPGSTSAPPADVPAVEARLLNATSLELRFRVTSAGAFTADLAGTLRLEQDPAGPQRVELAADGTFGEDAVTVRLDAAGDTMAGGAAQRRFSEPVPDALWPALALGLTRMGILHNLARLTAGLPPDHASGGVAEWVELSDVRQDEEASDDARVAWRFDIIVAGSRTAEATLWLDRATGLPLERRQVVTFPGGEMTVTETYDFVQVTGPMPGGR
ncbi:MAG TPA: hypothetical protein VK929_06670 [Longimicrobiales bacterium]|nr:hypothetical protein [Longimicrobiales bacterium]